MVQAKWIGRLISVASRGERKEFEYETALKMKILPVLTIPQPAYLAIGLNLRLFR